MKTLTAIIVSGIFALNTTACTCNYNSGLFNGKTVKASKNYVTKAIKVDNFTGVNLAGSPDVIYTQKAGKPQVEDIYVRQYRRPSGHQRCQQHLEYQVQERRQRIL